MIEITNLKRHPVQIVVRSKAAPKSFTTLNVPGVGRGQNVRYISDEMNTVYVANAEHNMKWIKTRQVPNEMSKGD